MKYRILELLFGLVFLAGLYLFAHDTVADQLNNLKQDQTLTNYRQTVSETPKAAHEAELEAARAHNAALIENTFGGDLFSGEGLASDDAYMALLNLNGDGVMGMVSIPKIHQTIPIYHGTDDSVLQAGAGHLPGTALPVGGESTHCVLAGHRGLPSARLFSDIDQLEIGDKIYLHVLDDVYAYQVQNILPMVPRDDVETLNAALSIRPGQDWLSLMTCTPYGINTHRLIVQAVRVPYNGEDDPPTQPLQAVIHYTVESFHREYALYIGAAVLLLAVIALLLRHRRKRKK